MKRKLKNFSNRFFLGLSTYASINTLFYSLYPFPFPERSLTFDWDNVGTDIYCAIEKLDKENERK